MSEITKLYENAEIKPDHYHCEGCEYDYEDICPDDCPNSQTIYPPFTAEKQLSLIKLLSKYIVSIDYDNGKYEVYILSIGNLRYDYYDTLEETLAYCINNLWQFLTKEDHKQIKEILE